MLDPCLDVVFECTHVVVDAASELALGEQPKPAFDLVLAMRSWLG